MLREPGSYFTRCQAFLDAGVLMLAQVHRLCNVVLINAGIGSIGHRCAPLRTIRLTAPSNWKS